MKILAFDQASKISGWAILDDGVYVKSGVIDLHLTKDTDTRAAEMGMEICKQIKKVKPDCVVIENVQSQGSVATVILLARLQGMILGYCYANNIRAEILAPSVWRSALSFNQGPKVKREELKSQAVNYVAEHLGKADMNVDEVEAVCIGMAASKFFK